MLLLPINLSHPCAVGLAVPEPSPPLLGARVSGVIDSRFDFGYFVTVHHHGQEFKGILYHQEPLAQGEIPVQPTFLPQATAEFLASPEPSKGKKKKRYELGDIKARVVDRFTINVAIAWMEKCGVGEVPRAMLYSNVALLNG
eukprot:3503540-Pyramimonas_sp.AAC.1